MKIKSNRREALSKTLLDFSKISVAAAFVTEFFIKFPLYARIIIWVALVGLIWLGIWTCPEKGE